MTTILLAIHVIITLLLIGVILLQKSEGGGLSGSSNSSGSAFSARGAANALTHATAILAGLFFLMCILLKWDSNSRVAQDDSILQKIDAQQAPVSESKKVEKSA